MLNEYELAQAAADRARAGYCAPAAEPASAPSSQETTPYVTVARDQLEALVARCESAMQHIPLGAASENLDTAYIDCCVAWAHARHMLRGTRPNAGRPLADLMLDTAAPVPQLRLAKREPAPASATARLIERGEIPCPGCVDRCGQCGPDEDESWKAEAAAERRAWDARSDMG